MIEAITLLNDFETWGEVHVADYISVLNLLNFLQHREMKEKTRMFFLNQQLTF